MRSLTALVTAALFCIVVDGQFFGTNDADVMDCFNYIVCEPGKLQEFRSILNRYKPKAMAQFMNLLRENADIPDAENNDASWSKFPENYCPRSEENKKELFSIIGKEMSDYWGAVCEEDDGDQEECDGIGDAVDGFSKLLSDYLARGECGSTSKALKAAKLPAFGR